MDQIATAEAAELPAASKLNPVEQSQLLLARLMEGGQEDDKTCQTLDRLTFLLNDEADWNTRREKTSRPKNFYASLPPDEEEKKRSQAGPICDVLDDVCVDTILGYLDMRQSDAVRDHATLTATAYFGAAKEKGSQALKKFFFDRVKRGAYDDYIVAFCVAAAVFYIAPTPTVQMFLSEGFLASLAPLMRRKWKSRKVETACLEMLNAASMHPDCRGPIRTYCTEWLEEVVHQDPEALSTAVHAADPDIEMSPGSISMRRHSQVVQNLAAVILAKLMAVPSTTQQTTQGDEGRIQPATTSIEDLSKKFTTLLLTEPKNDKGSSVEGLAYATIQPAVKEEVARNPELLKSLVNILRDAPAKSLITYGVLSIFVNLTHYQPVQSEEEKKMNQLKAYANAAGKLAAPNPLNDDSHVANRCKRVFEAGVISVLVTHSRHGSNASLSLIISIVYSLSVNTSLRGQLAQQGAVNLLIAAWTALPDTEAPAKRMAAQSLARILISTNPSLVFGGTRARPQNAAIRPLVSIIPPDPVAETRDLLPSFEALMALTNLASTDDDTRATIIRTAFPEIEEQLLSSHHLVSKAATELICNLVQCVEGIALYAAGTTQAADRLHILLALTDAEDEATRSAAGGALASLTAYEEVVQGIVKRKRGVEVVLGLCAEDSEDLRHRGVFVIHNMISQESEAGKLARKEIRDKDGLEILKTCAKKSRGAEVVEVTVQALKILLEEE